jgi:small subunit ribosomal protein S6e
MVEFKVEIADPETGHTWPVQVEGQHANALVRKRIGETVDGMMLELPGYEVEITGGTDKDGFPMRPEIPQAGRKSILVSDSTGFHAERGGQRRKRTFRGNEVSPDIAQVNVKIIDHGPKPVEDHLGEDDEGEDEDAAEDEG